MRINKDLARKLIRAVLSLMLIGSAVLCAWVRISGSELAKSIPLLTVGSTFHTAGAEKGKTVSVHVQESSVQESIVSLPEKVQKPEESSVPEESSQDIPSFVFSEPTADELAAYDAEHDGEDSYPVVEFTITQGDIAYKGIQVKNASSLDLDIKGELEGALGFKPEKTDKPQVLIYHTHTSESYLNYDTGYYYESFYPRSSDKNENVCAVGEEIASVLNSRGIVTLHDMTVHDDPSYSGAYDRSYDTVMKYIEKYPSIKVVLDIHRDGLGTDSQRNKPVFMADGHKAAQIMILAGYNADGTDDFKDWEYNLRFALRIQEKAQSKYPDMVRPLYLNDFMYNMNINTGSLLIEVGADSNTVQEARYSGYLLGNMIADVLEDNIDKA